MAKKSKTAYPDKGTAQRASLGTVMNFIGYGIKTLGHIILVPLFLAAWGKAMYGEWLTLFSLISYLSLSELGMGTYISNRMIQVFSEGNLKEYGRIFKSALALYFSLAAFGVIVVFGFAMFFPFVELFNITSVDEQTIRTTFLMLGGYILFGMLSSPIGELYTSTGEFVRSKTVSNIRELLLIGFVALTLWQGGEFTAIATWYLVLPIITYGFIYWDAVRRKKDVHASIKKARADWALAKTFLIPGLIYLLIPLADLITIQGAVILISTTLGPIAVAVFGVHRTLSNLISKVTTAIPPAILPEITAYEQRKNYKKVRLIFNIFLKISLFLSMSATAFLMFTGKNILHAWVNSEVQFSAALWYTLLATVPMTNLWRYSSAFQVATNQYASYANIRLASSIVSIFLAALLIGEYGLWGVVFGIFVGEFIIGIWLIPRKTITIVQEKTSRFFKTLAYSLPMFAAQLVAAYMIHAALSNVWLKLFSIAAAVGLIGLPYLFFIWFDVDEKNVTKLFVQRIWNRLKRD